MEDEVNGLCYSPHPPVLEREDYGASDAMMHHEYNYTTSEGETLGRIIKQEVMEEEEISGDGDGMEDMDVLFGGVAGLSDQDDRLRRLEGFKNQVMKMMCGMRKLFWEVQRGGENERNLRRKLEQLRGCLEENLDKLREEGLLSEEEISNLESDRMEEQVEDELVASTPQLLVGEAGEGRGHSFMEEDEVYAKRGVWTCECGHRCKSKAGLVNHIRISIHGSAMKNKKRITETNTSNSAAGSTPGLPNNNSVKGRKTVLFNSSHGDAPPSPPSSDSSAETDVSREESETAESRKELAGRRSKLGIQHGTNPSKPLECVCGLRFLQDYLLRRHVDYYLTDRTYGCRLCPKMFVNQGYLNNHYRTKHKSSNVIPSVDGRKRKFKQAYLSSVVKLEEPDLDILALSPFNTKYSFSFIRNKKRRNRRKRKLLRIQAKERISCSQCHRRFPHLRDLAKHLSRKMHNPDTVIVSTGKRSRSRKMGGIDPSAIIPVPQLPAIPSTSTSTQDSQGIVTRRRTSRMFKAAVPTTSVATEFVNIKTEPIDNEPEENIVDSEETILCNCGRNCDKRRRKAPSFCNVCGWPFICMQMLKEHVSIEHPISGKSKQKNIKKIKVTAKKKTIRQPSTGNEYKRCDYCDAGFRSSKGLRIHMEAAHNHPSLADMVLPDEAVPVPIPISVVGPKKRRVTVKKPLKPLKVLKARKRTVKSATVVTDVTVHMQMKSRVGSLLKCTCGKVYTNLKSLQKHLREQTFGKVFACPYCDFRFSKYFNMKVHVRDIHGVCFADQPRYGCGNCGQTFEKNADRILHRMAEHGQKPGEGYQVPEYQQQSISNKRMKQEN